MSDDALDPPCDVEVEEVTSPVQEEPPQPIAEPVKSPPPTPTAPSTEKPVQVDLLPPTVPHLDSLLELDPQLFPYRKEIVKRCDKLFICYLLSVKF